MGTAGLLNSVTEQRRLPAPATADPAVAAALRAPDLAPLFRFTAFPLVTSQPVAAGGVRLTVRDAKYNYFTYDITLDGANRVTDVRQATHRFGPEP